MQLKPIMPCLWFDHQAEEAARYYVSLFPNSRILRVAHFGKEGFEIHGRPEGSVMTVAFELNGQPFMTLNGGPGFTISEAVSLVIRCETQEEIDHYWTRLGEGGDPAAQVCGWVKDKFGVSWQVVPSFLEEMVGDPSSPASQRAMRAMLGMKKIVIRDLREAYGREPAGAPG